MRFPTLYRKTHTGKIQQWNIQVETTSDLCYIVTEYGEVGGKIQKTEDVVKEGKNIGKKNETTIYDQACLDAQSKWESKLKDGYVKTMEDAEAGKVDEIVEGGVDPMLAQSYDKAGDKIVFPCFVQPKLDGIRCIAIKQDGKVTLWSRSRKRITSCPHIENELAGLLTGHSSGVVLDGELYNHDLKADFESIISAVRKDDPTPESARVQYHIYDLVMDDTPFFTRTMVISSLLGAQDKQSIVLVETVAVASDEDLMREFKKFKALGYEGAIARNANGPYEHRRSNHLQKIKEFDDAEFEIVGVQEGKGKLRGNIGAFICKTSDGMTFEAKPKGNQDAWKPYLINPTLWEGRKLVVQYQGLTNKNSVPRFPVGLRLKDGVEG